MRRKELFISGLAFMCVLSGCFGGYDPNANRAEIFIGSGYTYPQPITETTVLINTDGFPDARTAVTAKIFLGDSRSVNALNVNGEGRSFSYGTSNSCQDLPQGNNIRIRYEKYDAQGKVMQEDFVIVSIDSCK
jgi:hypothetical protein